MRDQISQIILWAPRECCACAKIRLSKPIETDRKWRKSVTIPKTESEFELPNQFLVCVARKVIALSDLDLFLTEYFKERLNPQLKNAKNTHMRLIIHPLNWLNYLDCDYLPYLYLDPERNVTSCHSIVTLSSVGTIEQSFKQGVEGDVTPIGPYSSQVCSKDPSPISIPMYLRVIMPYPDSPGAPYFEGSKITDYQVDEQEKIKRLS